LFRAWCEVEMAGWRVLVVLLAAVCLLPEISPNGLCTAADIVDEKEKASCGVGEHLYGNSCFWVSPDDLPWSEAEDQCRARGMLLASLHSKEEHDFLSGLTESFTWIGLSDIAKEGRFAWTDGSPLDYENWRANVPDGGEAENCVYMIYVFEGEWDDYPCDDTTRRAACRGPAS